MKIHFHRTQAIPTKVAADIRRIFSDINVRFPGVQLPNIDVVLVDGWSRYGVNGNTIYTKTIMLEINMKRSWRSVRHHVERVLCHEMHHIGRWHTVGYGETLAEAVVTEGLAVNYEREKGCPAQPYAWKFTGSAREQILKAFKAERRRSTYSHYRWFFGSGDLPGWAGYRLGAELVDEYCRRTGAKPSELVATPASTILKNHPLLK